MKNICAKIANVNWLKDGTNNAVITIIGDFTSSECPKTLTVEGKTFFGLRNDTIYFNTKFVENGILKKYLIEPSKSMDDVAWYFFPSVKWVMRLQKEGVDYEEFAKCMCVFVETKDSELFLKWSGYDPVADTKAHQGETHPKTVRELFQVWKTKYIDRLPKMYGIWYSDIIKTCLGLYRNLSLFNYNPWAFHTLDVETIKRIPMSRRIEYGEEIHGLLKRLNSTDKGGVPLSEIPQEYHAHLESFYIKVVDGIAISETQIIMKKKILSLGDKTELDRIVRSSDSRLNDQQNMVVDHVCKYKYTLVTGGAGVGKTFTIKAIIDVLLNEPDKFRQGWVVAVAGKAVQRVKEVVEERENCYFSTIHSALNNLSTVCANPSFVIVDEISMTTLEEVYDLMMKLDSGARLIMFGDPKQLPPISGENIFQFDFVDPETLIQHEPIEQLVLTKSYRSNEGVSKICRDFLDGKCHTETIAPYFYFKDTLNYNALIDYIEILDRKKNTPTEIKYQIITPFVEEVNKIVQLLKQRKTIDDHGFFVGEKILVTKNFFSRYQDSIKKIVLANGEIGEYIGRGMFKIDTREYSVADVEVTSGEVLTIHKVQGSEFDTVIYWNPRESRFVTRELIYTALSRAKSKLILFGKPYN